MGINPIQGVTAYQYFWLVNAELFAFLGQARTKTHRPQSKDT